MPRTLRRRALTIAGVALTTTMVGGPAMAGHVHYVLTPNGDCHVVASGQTSIAEDDPGGHKFHDNVHLGATGEAGTAGDDFLGMGRAAVAVYKEGPAPKVCDGD